MDGNAPARKASEARKGPRRHAAARSRVAAAILSVSAFVALGTNWALRATGVITSAGGSSTSTTTTTTTQSDDSESSTTTTTTASPSAPSSGQTTVTTSHGS